MEYKSRAKTATAGDNSNRYANILITWWLTLYFLTILIRRL